MKIKALVAGVVMGGLMAGTAMAATDGAFSVTASQGTSVITANVGNLVRITGLDDLLLAPDALGDYVGTDTICVFRNGGDLRDYNITIDSVEGSFIVDDGLGNTMPYSVAFATAAAATHTGTYGATETMGLSSSNDVQCATSPNTVVNASFTVSIPAATVTLATPGSYTGTLQLTVEPI